MEVLFFLLEQFPKQPQHFPPKCSSVCVSRASLVRSIARLLKVGRLSACEQPSQTSRMPLTAEGGGVMPGEIPPVTYLGRVGSILLVRAEGRLHLHLLMH